MVQAYYTANISCSLQWCKVTLSGACVFPSIGQIQPRACFSASIHN